MKLRHLALAAVGSLCATAASAAPVQWTTGSGGNGHYYDFVSSGTNWTDARAAALASTYLGMNGYLATVTSAEENRFLGTIGSSGWLGGSDAAVEGEWRWVDGPEAGQLFWLGAAGGTQITYASWNGGEPNNAGNEDYLDRQGGAWNDLPNGSTLGYFVEYGGARIDAGVPEPATWAMMIAGFGLVGASLRRRKAAVSFA